MTLPLSKYIEGRVERWAKWQAASGGTRTSWSALRYGTRIQSDYDAPLVHAEEWETDALIKLLPLWAHRAILETHLNRAGRTLANVARGLKLCACKHIPEWTGIHELTQDAAGTLTVCEDESAAASLRNMLARSYRLLAGMLDQRRRGEPINLHGLRRGKARATLTKQLRTVGKGKHAREKSVSIASTVSDD
jgi:hypothetical protein